MAASIEQKVDYLLKKIGYTASKTGIAEDESLSGTKKAPFAEALPSPLVVPATSIYGQSELIPSTPPGTTSGVVQVYGTATAFQMTEDNTVSGQRSWLARSVQGDNSSDMVGDWIDTQFGPDYIINVYAGDPNAGGTKLSAAGSGSNDTWFFDYSSGVLNFNGDAAPTAVTGGADIYLVGYRYTGLKGTSGADGAFTDLNVTGVATFASDIQANGDIIGDGSTNISGINSVTATEYYGDGSKLTGVVAAASVGISSNGDYVGAAFTTLDYREGVNTEVEVVAVGNTAQVTIDLKSDVTIGGSFTASDLYGTVRGPAVNVETLTVSGDSSLADVQVSGALTTTGPATLGAGSTMLGTGYIEHLEVRSGATISGVTTFKGDVNFEGNSITGTIEQADRAFRLDAPLTPGTNNVSFALPLVETPGLDTSFVTTQEVTYNPASGILTAPSAVFTENVDVVGVLTAGTLRVDNPLENVVITDVIITGDAAVGGALTVTGVIDANGGVEGNLEGSADKVDVTDVSTTNTDFTLAMTDGANTVDGRSVGMDSDLTYNPSTNTLTAGTFSGSLVGTASSANQVLVTPELSSATQHFINFSEQSLSPTDLHRDSTLTYTPSTDTLAAVNVSATTLTASGEVEGGSLDINGVADISGNLDVGGDLTVAGTLTYEDVTDIDSIGLITARSGIHVLTGGIDVQAGVVTSADGFDTAASVSAGGSVTAANFYGDGSNLTGLEAALNGGDVTFGDVQVGGALTVTGATDLNGDLDVDGHTELDDVFVAGISTFDGTTNFDGVTEFNADANFNSGTVTLANIGTFDTLVESPDATFTAKVLFDGGLEVSPGELARIDGSLDVDGQTDLDDVAISGVTTATGLIEANGGINVDGAVGGNAGIVTTGDLASGGPITIGDLNVTGVSTFTGLIDADGGLEVAGGATIDGGLTSDNINNTGVVTSATYNVGSTTVLETVNGQVSLSGIATLDATTKATIEREIALAPNDFASLNITGLSTFAGLADFNGGIDVSGGATLDELNVTGVATVGGALDANGGADLSGGVTADELTVVGFATVGGDLLANANLDVTDQTTLNTLRATGVATFVSSVQVDGDLTANGDIIGDGSTDISGIASVTATEFYGDGSNLTGLEAGLDGLNVTLGDVTVGGALTVTGATDINGDIDIDGHAEVDELRVSGVSTFVAGATFQENVAVLGQGSIQTLVVGGNSSLQDTQVGGALTVTGATDLNGALDVQGNTNLQADLGVGGTSNFSDLASFQDNINANASLSVADDLSVSDIFSVVSTGELQEFLVDGVTGEFNDGIRVDGTVSGNAGIVTTGDLAGTISGLDIAPRHINASGIITAAGAIDANGGLDVAGGATLDALTVTGNTTLGDASSDTVSFVASVGTGLTPSANATHDLGANELRFANVYGGQFIGTSMNVSDDVTIGGNLSVGGTITAVEVVDLQVISPVVELGLENAGDGTLQPPSEQTLYSSGIAMWYNRVGVSSDNAQAAAMFADVKPSGTYRIGFATDVSFSGYGTTDSISTVNGWAEIEAKALWMNDCAGQSVVIDCTGTERFLNNITVDGGTF